MCWSTLVLSSLFHIACFQHSSMLELISKFHSFLLLNRYCIVPIYCILFIHSFVDVHFWIVSTFWLLWIMPLWIWVYRYLFETPLSILGWYIPRSWIGGSYGNYIFHCGGNHHTLFFSSCTVLPPHQQCTRFIGSLLPCQYLLPWVVFFQ